MIFTQIAQCALKRVKHIEQLQLYISTIALGNDNKPGHWKCPIKNGDKVSDASFTEGQAKVLEENLAEIIKKVLTLEESLAADWTEVYKSMMWMLTTRRQREDFTDDKVVIVGLQIDEWSVKCIDIVGKESMTNYIHSMTSGHVGHYLKLWRDFYRYISVEFQQQ
jgi:hypothetical protein